MTAETRCERTDLPASMCAHCLGHVNPGDPDRLTPGDVGVRFTSRYDGTCGNCGKRTDAGTVIGILTDGTGYACERCLP